MPDVRQVARPLSLVPQLRRVADDGEEEFGTDAAAFIGRDLYVDDGLKSVSTVPKAIQLIKASQAICSKARLTLHKISLQQERSSRSPSGLMTTQRK